MRKLSFSKGVSATLVAMALVTGLSIPVDAAKTDKALSQQEVTKSGATIVTAAPQISLKESTASGQRITSWTVNYTPVPEPVKRTNGDTRSFETRIFVFDKGDRTNPLNGDYYIDDNGKRILTGGKSISYVNPYEKPDYKYEVSISAYSLTPGKKEIVAMMFDAAGYEADYTAALAAGTEDTLSKADYMVASAPIEITVSDEAFVNTAVTSTSVQLDMYTYGTGDNTGYEIYRKVGKKYQKIATIASNTYTDKGLLSKTTYSYKIRPYYKDDKGAIVYGKEKTVEATTKGSAMNLMITLNSKNKPQLTWKKVAGVKQYEIYRADTSSYDTTISKGLGNGYSTYKKIATVKKSKKKYVDTKVSANRNYYYIVRAVIAKDKKVKGDKDAYIEQGGSASLSFGSVSPKVTYTAANGDVTVQWSKVAGAKSYVVEKNTYDAQKNTYDWTTFQTLGKNATKTVLPAEVVMSADGSKVVSTTTEYRIKAFNGTSYSTVSSTIEAEKAIGTVQKVTAKQVANGVQVSWTPVAGASYYRVYRCKADAVANNKDIGGYNPTYGTIVTEYVGAQAPVAIDVAAWNAEVDQSIAAYKANPNANYSDYLHESDKLNDKKTYHYQNYSYLRNVFDANTTSILDYYGDIYEGYGSYEYKTATKGADGKAAVTEWSYHYNPVVADEYVKKSGTGTRPQVGVEYIYYVEAVQATAKTPAELNDYSRYYYDYSSYSSVPFNDDYYNTKATVRAAYNTAVTGPKVNDSEYATTAPLLQTTSFKNVIGSTSGVKQYGKVTYTNTQAVKTAPKIKTLTASKGKVTLKLKKKIKAADYYKIYRATKKKGKYTVAGVTKNAKTISFKDAGVLKGKTYFYKVVPVVKNEAGAEVEGKASKVKSVKVK